MKLRLALAATTALLAVTTPALADNHAATPVAAEASQTEHEKLFALFEPM